MVRTLGKLLAPLSNPQASDINHLDITLIGWVLLFLSVCLDTIAIPPTCLEENSEKNREQGTYIYILFIILIGYTCIFYIFNNFNMKYYYFEF